MSADFDVAVSGAGQYQLGRSKEAALRIRHPTVSRRHAILIISDDDMIVYLRHDSGTNGTFLNGRKIQKVEPLEDGDQVKVGEVTLTARIKKT